MSQFVRVEGGQVVQGPQALPRAFAGIRGFQLLPDHERRRHGWFQVVDDLPVLTEREQLSEPTFVIEATRVRRVYQAVSKPQQDLDEIDFRADPIVAALAADQDLDGWVDGQVNNIADARRILKVLARAVRLQVRRSGQVPPAPSPQQRALSASGAARRLRQARRLAEDDPIAALLQQGGLK